MGLVITRGFDTQHSKPNKRQIKTLLRDRPFFEYIAVLNKKRLVMKHSKSGSLLRFMAFSLDMVLAMTVLNLGWDLEGTQQIYTGMASKFKRIGVLDGFFNSPDLLASLLMVWGSFYLIKFLSTIVLGVSLGQSLLGIFIDHPDTIKKRILGGVRVFIESLTSPFLFPDLPSLIGNLTLKEKLTDTILLKNPRFFLFRIGFGIPLFITVSALFVMINLTYSSPEYKTHFIIRSFENKRVDNTLELKEVSSPIHRFKVLSSIENFGVKIIPSFTVEKSIKGKRISPKIVFYDSKNNVELELEAYKKFKLFDYLLPSIRGNVLIGLTYPEFLAALDEPERYNPVPQEDYHPDKILFSRKLKAEVKAIIQTSFELERGNIFSTMISNGPFINGFQTVKHKILGLFPKGGETRIEFTRLGGQVFLKVEKKWSLEERNSLNLIHYFIPIETNNVQSFKISGTFKKENLSKVRDLEKQIMTSFFGTSNWYFDYEKTSDPNKLMEKPNAFSVVNLFMKNDASPDLRRRLEEYTYNFVYKIGAESLSSKSNLSNDIILRSINSIKYAAQVKSHDSIKYFSKEFHSLLGTLHRNLENKNLGFFGVL